MHVKKGDKVIVISGKEKGKTSTVTAVLREKNRVVLDGLNKMKKHIKPTQMGGKGSMTEISMSIHASNVKLADKTKKNEKPAAKSKKVTKKEVKKEDK